MIDYADLRRLAEQAIKPAPTRWWDEQSLAQIQGISPDAAYIAAANPQAILALLDLRDGLLVRLGQATERAKSAERRVAALEELVRAAEVYISHYVPVEAARIDGFDPESWASEARALLTSGSAEPEGSGSAGAGGIASPSEPQPWLTIHGVEYPHRGNDLPDHIPGTYPGRCPDCDPAALRPSDSEPAEGLADWIENIDKMAGRSSEATDERDRD